MSGLSLFYLKNFFNSDNFKSYVSSESKIFHQFSFIETNCENDLSELHDICKKNCKFVNEQVLQNLTSGSSISITPNLWIGILQAFARFSDGLYVTLKHLIETNNLNRSAFKNLIKPMAVLINQISRLTGDEDWTNFSFLDISSLSIKNELEFNANGKKINFKDPKKHAELIEKVRESSNINKGCPMRNVDLDVDLDGTGKTKKVNIIKVLYYLCARQVEMALFGRKTETPL